MKKSDILIIFIAILAYLFLKSLNLEGVDIAYPKIYQNSNNLNSFFDFSISGGSNSVTLWIYYIFSNTIGLSYEMAHFFISIIYIYSSIKLSFLLKSKLQKNINNYILICYPLFLFLGNLDWH